MDEPCGAGQRAEAQLATRISKVWKTDFFLADEARHRHVAATIKSNWHQLEGGPGLRLGIVTGTSRGFVVSRS